MEEKFPNIKDKISILYNLVDYEQIVKLSDEKVEANLFPSTTICLLTVGRMAYEKGPDIAVEVCYYLVKNGYDIVWYWIGDGNESSKIMNKIKERKIQKNFYLLGNKINPYKYMKKCDIYVQPSRYEAYCTTTNEARILCKTIVATKVGGMEEQIIDGKTGYLVDVDVNDIYQKIKKLIVDYNDRVCIENNLKSSHESFSNYIREYDKLFDNI